MIATYSWIGKARQDIETPSLLVDLEALERNLGLMRDLCAQRGIRYRPHTKTHKSPLVARKQIEAGAVGVCCAKLGEAEVLALNGVSDILLTTEVVTERKIERLISLARQCRISVVVDDAGNVDALATAARRSSVALTVLVDVDVGQGRCGVVPGPEAVALAVRVSRSGSLSFGGIQGYHGGVQMVVPLEERRARVQAAAALLGGTAEQIRGAGMECPVLSGGGTGTALLDAEGGVLTELQPGSYVYMDSRYSSIEWAPQQAKPPFLNALTVLGTVISRPTPDRAIVDVGMKAASSDQGPIQPLLDAAIRFEFAGDEHGILRLDGGSSGLKVGDRVEFIPSHCDTTVNLHDRIFVHRNGVIEDVWPVAARGCVW